MRLVDLEVAPGRVWQNVPVPDDAVAVRANGVRITIPPVDGLVPDYEPRLELHTRALERVATPLRDRLKRTELRHG